MVDYSAWLEGANLYASLFEVLVDFSVVTRGSAFVIYADLIS